MKRVWMKWRGFPDADCGVLVLLWCLIVIGSSVFVSINTVLTRKRAFEARFKSLLRRQKEGRRERRRSLSLVRSGEEVGKRFVICFLRSVISEMK